MITGGGYANGQLFHQDCFKCHNCKVKLEGKFFTKEKKPFCQDCFKVDFLLLLTLLALFVFLLQIYEKSCEVCGKSIFTNCVESNEKFYHSECMKVRYRKM